MSILTAFSSVFSIAFFNKFYRLIMEFKQYISTIKANKHFSRYILAIVITTLLVITNQIIIQTSLSFKEKDATTINIAGKQRMLSQRLMAQVFHYQLSDQKNTVEINETYTEWKNVHYDLQSDMLFMESNNSRKNTIVNPLKALDDKVEYANKTINALGNLSNEDLSKFKENQELFLVEMDKYVKSLEKASNTKLAFIKNIELLLALLTLFVIAIEVLFIFKPVYLDLTRKTKILDNNLYSFTNSVKGKLIDVREKSKTILGYTQILNKNIENQEVHKSKIYLNQLENFAKEMDADLKEALNINNHLQN